MTDLRIGHGYDVHRFASGRDLILGGVKIPYEKGLLGHSDADVLLHAIMDSILGAMGLSDIGKHFPDSDEKYRGISSLKLLGYVYDMLDKEGGMLVNVDATVIAQAPKIAPYIEEMKEKIGAVLKCPNINIKATTEEGLGFTGRLEGISAHAVCLITKK